MERFNLRKLSDLEVMKQYQIKISNRFAALENLNGTENINRSWENIKESLGLYELEQHKPWFDEEYLLIRIHGSRLKSKIKASRLFRNKTKLYLKAKIDELEINSKIKNIRDLYKGISDFKMGYQPRTNIVRGEGRFRYRPP